MNQLTLKKFISVFYFVGIVFFFGTTVVLADVLSLSDMKHINWEGKITIKVTGSSAYDEYTSSENKEFLLSGSKDFEAIVIIKACGNTGSLYIKEADWSFRNKEKENKAERYKETRCKGFEPVSENPDVKGKKDSYSVSPGNSEVTDKIIEEDIYLSTDCKSPEEETMVQLNFLGGKYYLLAGSSVHCQIIRGEIIKTETSVCSGDTSTFTTNIVTIPFSISEAEQMIFGTNSFTIRQHPRHYPLSISPVVEGVVQKDGDVMVIQGRIEPREIEGSDYDASTYEASWRLEGKYKCDEVFRVMTLDLSYAEAFANKGLMDEVKKRKIKNGKKRIDTYKKLVDREAKKDYQSSSGIDSRSNPDTKSDMSTRADCKIDPDKKRKFKKRIARKCLPKILYKASLVHEKMHVSQCRKNHAAFIHGGKEDPYTYGMMEVPAYLAGAEVLLKWLKDYCGNKYDLSEVEAQMNTLKSLPLSMKYDYD